MPQSKRPQPRTVQTVFLDRDGVINEKMPEGHYVRCPEEFHMLPGVPEAIARLNRAGMRVVVVSNQRGVSLGLYTPEDVRAVHTHLQQLLDEHGAHIDAIYFCPHDKGRCDCRKPLSGMFEQAVRDCPEIAADTSVIVGDSLSDIEFGRRLGMQTIFLQGDPSRSRPGAELASTMADRCFRALPEAVDDLLNGNTLVA